MNKNGILFLIITMIFQINLFQCMTISSIYKKVLYGNRIEKPVDPQKLSIAGYDFRVFQNNPVWSLAKAIALDDLAEIERLSEEYRKILDTPEPRFGDSLLTYSIRTQKEEAVKILLENGADPNFRSKLNGNSPVQFAASSSIPILKVILQKGGNPNYKSESESAALYKVDSLEKLKLVLDAGADISKKNQFGGNLLLNENLLYNRLDNVLYLLRMGIDFRGQLGESVGDNYGKPKEVTVPLFIADKLRFKNYPLDSDNYKIKMKIVEFLKENGIDYWKTPIPEAMIIQIDRIAKQEGWWEDEKKRYLEKY